MRVLVLNVAAVYAVRADVCAIMDMDMMLGDVVYHSNLSPKNLLCRYVVVAVFFRATCSLFS